MSAQPVRLRLSRARGFDLQSASITWNGREAVNVARPGPWGNPFKIGRNGTRARCVSRFATLAEGMLITCPDPSPETQRQALEWMVAHLDQIRGRNLACWCPIDGPCHADVLLRIAARIPGEAPDLLDFLKRPTRLDQ